MKILLVHNFYSARMPSGENQVFERERQLLESNGHEVQVFTRHNEDYLVRGIGGLVRGAASVVWNRVSAREMRVKVAEFEPQIVHAHNTFPIISPSIFSAASGAARVLTLHNYRLFCASGVVFRNGNVCTECLDRRSSAPAVLHGCYRNSRIATLPVAAHVAIHRRRGTWTADIDAFIALTKFQKKKVVSAGIPEERVFVKPNFCREPKRIVPWSERRDRVVFVGRLSPEKGVNDLISAWLKWGDEAPQLVLLGDGPMRSDLEARIDMAKALNIRIVGQVDGPALEEWVGGSKLSIVPSRALETFGLAAIEAMALGTPVLVSDVGSLPDLVKDGGGGVFRAGDPCHLLNTIRDLWSQPQVLHGLSVEGRMNFERSYDSASNYQQLIAIYESATQLKRFTNLSSTQ
jgi:glycosyltransferase involved in cell wall biosynthesis